jgi:REP element-mobilizing transposase RayT
MNRHMCIEKLMADAHDASMNVDRHVPFHGFDPYGEVNIARRRLPHWRQSGATYFITFRLADSLPQSLLHQWQHERAIWLRWHPPPWGADEQLAYEERFTSRLQEWLDAGVGACHLRRSDVRAKVEHSLLHFDGKRYAIDAFVLMPNHVHAVIAPTDDYDLSMILRGIKGVSANECNKLLRRKSSFWMEESYDHIVRDANELTIFRVYVSENPGKAGLKPEEYSLQIRNALAI